jgi:PPOX class probable F420-dependent enzyme
VAELERASALALFSSARVVRLATVRADGAPHAVPICFAVEGDVVYSAVDHKPKRSRALQRLANIAANPAVSLLADEYSEDWSALWWVRADGIARVMEAGEPEHDHASRLLRARYPQYVGAPSFGPVIVVQVDRWTGWRSTPAAPGAPQPA